MLLSTQKLAKSNIKLRRFKWKFLQVELKRRTRGLQFDVRNCKAIDQNLAYSFRLCLYLQRGLRNFALSVGLAIVVALLTKQ